MIGIISYLPDTDNLRSVRVRNCKRQLDWLHKLFPNEVPLVVAQNYTHSDMVSEFNIEYNVYPYGIGSHRARNIILQRFYNSTDTWLFLMDDDVSAYDYYDADTFIRNVYYNKYSITSDIIIPLAPETTPFKALNIKNNIAKQYYLSRSAATNCPNMMLFRRPDKGCEIFFDDSIDLLADDAIPDDNKFVIECIYSGMRVHRADFWVKKSMDRQKSVIYSDDIETNYAQHANLGKNLTKYVRSTYNVKSIAEFNKIYNKAVPICISRGEPYSVPENLLPKKSVDAKRLF